MPRLLPCLLPLLLASLAAGDSGEPAKVAVALYYESLCPYSARFVVNHLAKIFHDGLLGITDLTLAPYGNAYVHPDGAILCQHGPDECLLNTVEACAIDAWPDLDVHFKFIYCVENLVVKHKYKEWNTCFARLGLDPKPVKDCYQNGHGQELELKYARETDALVPPHRYVPWVVVNGQPLYEEYENFETYICKAYKGDPPKACKDLVPPTAKVVKADGSVTYNDGINLAADGGGIAG